MKKSQLRKIIRESIKGLIKETTPVVGIYRSVFLFDCSITQTSNFFFGGLPYPEHNTSINNPAGTNNLAHVFHNVPLPLPPGTIFAPGQGVPGPCVYLTDISGNPVSASQLDYPMMVEYQGDVYLIGAST